MKEHVYHEIDFAVPFNIILGLDARCVLDGPNSVDQLKFWIQAMTGQLDLTHSDEEKENWIKEWDEEKKRRETLKKNEAEKKQKEEQKREEKQRSKKVIEMSRKGGAEDQGRLWNEFSCCYQVSKGFINLEECRNFLERLLVERVPRGFINSICRRENIDANRMSFEDSK